MKIIIADVGQQLGGSLARHYCVWRSGELNF